jgi:hypothetical protein
MRFRCAQIHWYLLPRDVNTYPSICEYSVDNDHDELASHFLIYCLYGMVCTFAQSKSYRDKGIRIKCSNS